MKRIFAIFLALALAFALGGCSGSDDNETIDGVTQLSFSKAVDFNTIKKLNGKSVAITGYMATLSPVSGKYMYLMNLPYQSCPFCLPNSTQLSNTMAVYAENGKTFAFTDQPIRVTGKIEVSDYTDEFGYQYNYRIVNAKYETVDMSSISPEYALWQSVASDGIVADVYSMFDYLYYLCQWTEYTGYSILEDGTRQDWYMYPGDVERYLANTGAYGFAKQSDAAYFPTLIARVNAINASELQDFVKVIEAAQALEIYARKELADQQYVYDPQADKFTLNKSAELLEQYRQVYLAFDNWLARWEM